MCNICKFKFELPDSIRENAPEYTEEEVHATYCRIVGVLEACHKSGFEIKASIGASEFHHHDDGGDNCNNSCGDVNYVLVIGERGPEAVGIQFFLGAHNGIHIVSTTTGEDNGAGLGEMFRYGKNTVTPLVTIQDWIDEDNQERSDKGVGHLFLFCYYTDSDIDPDWELQASRRFAAALRAASQDTHDRAKDRARVVRSNLKHEKDGSVFTKAEIERSEQWDDMWSQIERQVRTDDPEGDDA